VASHSNVHRGIPPGLTWLRRKCKAGCPVFWELVWMMCNELAMSFCFHDELGMKLLSLRGGCPHPLHTHGGHHCRLQSAGTAQLGHRHHVSEIKRLKSWACHVALLCCWQLLACVCAIRIVVAVAELVIAVCLRTRLTFSATLLEGTLLNKHATRATAAHFAISLQESPVFHHRFFGEATNSRLVSHNVQS
jgi:hypothetical protein